MATGRAASRARRSSSRSSRSSTANRNVSYNTADGRSVRIKDGVKTYSDKPLQVTGKGGISISGKEYSRDRGGTGFAPITPESLNAPPPPPNVPPAPVTNPGDVVGMKNAALAPGLASMGINYDPKKGFQPAPQQQTTSTGGFTLNDIINQKMAALSGLDTPNYERLYNQTYKDSGKRSAEQDVNTYTAQINSIVANRDANMLRLEGQGRGITDVIIGGQQAQIQKEAAIAALPIQAQLAAAQGRLDMANEYINTMFTIKKADADAKYQRSLSIIDAYFDYADKIEQRQFEELKTLKAQQYDREQANLQIARQGVMAAVETGQSNLISAFAELDPKSANFDAEYNRLLAQVRKPVVATGGGGIKPPTIKTINGVDYQWNEQTGQWENVQVAGGPQGSAQSDKVVEQMQFLRNTTKRALEIAQDTSFLKTPVGPSRINRLIGDTLVGNTSFRQLQSLTDTLKTNMLTVANDPSIRKFFGPQMSNADINLMLSAGSTLDPQSQNPKDYIAEIKRLDSVFNKLSTAATTNGAYSANVVTAPDGTLIELID